MVGAPKLGLLKSIITSYLKKELDDVLIVPVAVDYDRIPEGSSYAHMALGKPKVVESLWNLLGAARTMLFRKHGSVHIRHGDPYSLKGIIGTKGDGSSYTIDDEKVVVELVGNAIGSSLTSCTCIMSSALLATVILSSPRSSYLTEDDILTGISLCVYTLHALGARLFVPGNSKDIFDNTLPNIQHMLDQRESFEGTALYRASSERHLITELVMYQNMTMNILLPEAIAALSVSTLTPLYHASLLSNILEGEISGVQVYGKVVELINRSRSFKRPTFLLHYIYPIIEAYVVCLQTLLEQLTGEGGANVVLECDYETVQKEFLQAPVKHDVKYIESFTTYRMETVVATLVKRKVLQVVQEKKKQTISTVSGPQDVATINFYINELKTFIQ
jgi:glycerol-3-phosphate O-acyltransferase